jgi:hypothetical protein
VGDNGTNCRLNDGTVGGIIRGITHMRYDCTDQSIWILTYVVPGTDLQANNAALWTDTDCGGVDPTVCMTASGSKTFGVGATAGACDTTCNTNPALRSNMCCLNTWPVTDTVTQNGVQVEVQVGYIVKGYFTLTATNKVAWDTILVHWDWQTSSDGGTGSSSALSGSGGNGICLNCAGEAQASSNHGQLM